MQLKIELHVIHRPCADAAEQALHDSRLHCISSEGRSELMHASKDSCGGVHSWAHPVTCLCTPRWRPSLLSAKQPTHVCMLAGCRLCPQGDRFGLELQMSRDNTQITKRSSPRLSSEAFMPQASTRAVEQPM